MNALMCYLLSLEVPFQPMEPITKLDENAIVHVDGTNIQPLHSESMKENTEHVDIVDEPNHRLQTQGSTTFPENVDIVDEPNHHLQTQGSTSFKDQTGNPLEADPNKIVLERSEPKSTEHSYGFIHEESVPSSNSVCLYRFCSKCLFNLKSVMQKLITSQWDSKPSNLTAEDVDDVITSLSLNLSTTVRKFCLSDNIMKVFEVRSCECEVSGSNGIECGCHSESDISGGHGVDLEVISKNGVAVVVPETEMDVCYDCKFQKLCLCSLIEYIVMSKQPSG